MSATFVQSAGNDASGSGTSLAVTVSATGSGNLLVLVAKSEVGGNTTVTASDGTSSFTAGRKVIQTGADLIEQVLYLLSSNSGKTSITVTWAAARSFRRVRVMEYSATGAFSADVDAGTTYDGGAGSVDSGNVTTTGSDELCFGAYGEANGATPSSPLINGAAADHTESGGGFTTLWSKAVTGTFTGSASLTASGPSVIAIQAFKIAAGGGGSRGLFLTPPVSGIGIGGSFFRNPLQAPMQMVRRDRIFVPAWLGKAA